jgi:hypothetical protein
MNASAQLGIDEWSAVAKWLDPRSLAAFAGVGREARAVAREEMCNVSLAHLPRVVSQGPLCELLHLKSEEARALSPRAEVPHRGYNTRWFAMAVALPELLVRLGGWAALARRLAKRNAKRRKRANLQARREEAAAKRRARLDERIAARRPFGAMVANFEEWKEMLEMRNVRCMEASRMTRPLENYLSAKTLEVRATLDEAWEALLATANARSAAASFPPFRFM